MLRRMKLSLFTMSISQEVCEDDSKCSLKRVVNNSSKSIEKSLYTYTCKLK